MYYVYAAAAWNKVGGIVTANICTCGAESLSTTGIFTFTAEKHPASTGTTYHSIPRTTYETWFTLSNAASNSDCTIASYALTSTTSGTAYSGSQADT